MQSSSFYDGWCDAHIVCSHDLDCKYHFPCFIMLETIKREVKIKWQLGVITKGGHANLKCLRPPSNHTESKEIRNSTFDFPSKPYLGNGWFSSRYWTHLTSLPTIKELQTSSQCGYQHTNSWHLQFIKDYICLKVTLLL